MLFVEQILLITPPTDLFHKSKRGGGIHRYFSDGG